MPNKSAFGSNQYNVEVQALDYSDAQHPSPDTMTYHGLSIVVKDNIIGRIQNWTVAGVAARDAKHIYEISHLTWGRPVDLVPLHATGYEMTIDRMEVWDKEIEKAFGYSAVFDDLIDQTKPFTLLQYLYKGKDLYRSWQYSGCWMTKKDESAATPEGDVHIMASCTVKFVGRIRTYG